MFSVSVVIITIALLSLWVKKTPWLWGSLAIISLFLAEKSNKLSLTGFIPLAIASFCFWMLFFDLKGLTRFLLVSIALFVTGAVFSCLSPGLPHCFELYGTQINYGKIVLTLPLLAAIVPILSDKASWIRFFSRHLALSAIGAFIIIAIAYVLHPPSFSFFFLKTPFSFLIWIPLYLIGTIIPEETLLRGFLQTELAHWTGKGFIGHAVTVLITASLFSLFHLIWVVDLDLLGLIFLAGVIYGSLYQITRTIEACIICRLLTSCLYFCILSREGFL